MRQKQGFSLLEITLVTLIMGLTITALLQTLEWSQARYAAASQGWRQRLVFTEIRLWLRDRVISSELEQINLKNLSAVIKLPPGLHLAELRLREHHPHTWFVTLDYFNDRNRNGKPDPGESETRLFCFRERTA